MLLRLILLRLGGGGGRRTQRDSCGRTSHGGFAKADGELRIRERSSADARGSRGSDSQIRTVFVDRNRRFEGLGFRSCVIWIVPGVARAALSPMGFRSAAESRGPRRSVDPGRSSADSSNTSRATVLSIAKLGSRPRRGAQSSCSIRALHGSRACVTTHGLPNDLPPARVGCGHVSLFATEPKKRAEIAAGPAFCTGVQVRRPGVGPRLLGMPARSGMRAGRSRPTRCGCGWVTVSGFPESVPVPCPSRSLTARSVTCGAASHGGAEQGSVAACAVILRLPAPEVPAPEVPAPEDVWSSCSLIPGPGARRFLPPAFNARRRGLGSIPRACSPRSDSKAEMQRRPFDPEHRLTGCDRSDVLAWFGSGPGSAHGSGSGPGSGPGCGLWLWLPPSRGGSAKPSSVAPARLTAPFPDHAPD